MTSNWQATSGSYTGGGWRGAGESTGAVTGVEEVPPLEAPGVEGVLGAMSMMTNALILILILSDMTTDCLIVGRQVETEQLSVWTHVYGFVCLRQ